MMKCEAVKTIFKSEDYGLEDHTLTIDKIVELDPQGELLDSAKVWIQCGCPSDCDASGFPRKWDAEALHAWVAG